MEQRPDVVVVGAGAVGLATAFFLSRAGARVLVVEREAIGSAASGHAAGILSPLAEVDGPPALDDLAREGLRLHRSLAPALQEESGMDVYFRPMPVLRPAFDEAEAQALRAEVGRRQALGVLQWLDGQDARALEPRLSPAAIGAWVAPEEAQIDAYRLSLALAQAAERRGAVIRHGEVAGLLREGQRVTGVVLGSEPLACEQVILAAGPWTGLMEAWVGWPIPVTPLRGQILRLRVPGPPLRSCLLRRGNYVLHKGDGLTTAGTTEELVGFVPRPTGEARASIVALGLQLAPSLRDAEIVAQTACLRPLSADGLPLLGPVPGRDGLYLATGHGRRGILLSLVSGQAMAELVLHGQSSIPLAPFAPSRFASVPPPSPPGGRG